MAGILDSQCTGFFFPMECDVYYASESQDKYGEIEKSWTMDRSIPCSFYTLNDESNYQNFTFDDKKFFRLETMLFGRTRTDVRKNSQGLFYPVSHILITNIRPTGCGNNESFFVETNGDYAGVPTIFEIKMIHPFIGPFGSTEYFKVQLERSDTQELSANAVC